jgi:hypothetical protein
LERIPADIGPNEVANTTPAPATVPVDDDADLFNGNSAAAVHDPGQPDSRPAIQVHAPPIHRRQASVSEVSALPQP